MEIIEQIKKTISNAPSQEKTQLRKELEEQSPQKRYSI